MRVSTPTVPVSLKRKAAAMDPEEDESDKARRAKIMQFMNPRHNMTYTPSYESLSLVWLFGQR
jgi:transcription factor SPT20